MPEEKEEKKTTQEVPQSDSKNAEATGKEEKKEAKEKAALPSKFADLVKKIEEMSVADLAELVKILEDRFGVSAAAPVAMVGPSASAGGTGAAEAEEKSSYTVMLKDGGGQKIAVIKAVREINQDLGLVEAKNLVESAPKEVKKDLPKEEAEEAKKKLETAGATVELV